MRFSQSELATVQTLSVEYNQAITDYAVQYDGALLVEWVYVQEEAGIPHSVYTMDGMFFHIVDIDVNNREQLRLLDTQYTAYYSGDFGDVDCGCYRYKCQACHAASSPALYLLLYFRHSDVDKCSRFIPATFKLARVDITGQIYDVGQSASCYIELVA